MVDEKAPVLALRLGEGWLDKAFCRPGNWLTVRVSIPPRSAILVAEYRLWNENVERIQEKVG